MKSFKSYLIDNISSILFEGVAEVANHLKKIGYSDTIAHRSAEMADKYKLKIAPWIAREIKTIVDREKTSDEFSANAFENMIALKLPLYGGMSFADLMREWMKDKKPNLMSKTENNGKPYEYAGLFFVDLGEYYKKEIKGREESKKYKTDPVVYKFPNGYTIVKLSPESCKLEGEFMQHCVAGYADTVKEGKTEIYSLRDPQGNPHATIEMKNYGSGYVLRQVQGKQNEPPDPKYKALIATWLQSFPKEHWKENIFRSPSIRDYIYRKYEYDRREGDEEDDLLSEYGVSAPRSIVLSRNAWNDTAMRYIYNAYHTKLKDFSIVKKVFDDIRRYGVEVSENDLTEAINHLIDYYALTTYNRQFLPDVDKFLKMVDAAIVDIGYTDQALRKGDDKYLKPGIDKEGKLKMTWPNEDYDLEDQI